MKPNQTNQNRSYNINVLAKTFRVLEAFSEDGEEAGMAELIGKLHTPKSTVHRLVMILERHGYLERAPLTGKYHLGSKLIHLGMHALSELDLGEMTVPFLERLAEQTGETTHLGVLSQGEVISLFHAQGRHVLRPPSTVGSRDPAYCTATTCSGARAIRSGLSIQSIPGCLDCPRRFPPPTLRLSCSNASLTLAPVPWPVIC